MDTKEAGFPALCAKAGAEMMAAHNRLQINRIPGQARSRREGLPPVLPASREVQQEIALIINPEPRELPKPRRACAGHVQRASLKLG